MRPFSLGVTIVMQGLYTMAWIVVLFDVASPALNLQGLPNWSATEAVFAGVITLTAAVGLGLVVHTVSRSVFRVQKDRWTQQVLESPTVAKRLKAVGATETFKGGPSYDDISEADEAHRAQQAGAFFHAVVYQLMERSPQLWKSIQVYRDQYRLARAFVLPSAAFALVLPLWAPVEAFDATGYIGPLPVIRTQLVLLSILAAAVSYVAFRERTYRSAAATMLAYATLQGWQEKKG